MIITCEQCETSFNLDESLLKPAGSKVRCSKCKHIFVACPSATAPEGKETAAQAGEMDVAAEGVAEASETIATTETETAAGEEELDLSGLEEELRQSEEPKEAAAGPAGEDLMLDLDLDLDVEAEKKPAGAAAGEEELDLSGLEDELQLSEEPKEAAAGPAGEDLTLDLDLDLDVEAEKEPAGAAAGEEELDISGLEDELQLSEEPKEAAAGVAGEDLTLDFDLGLDVEAEKEPAGAAAGEEELDLSDIERMLAEETPAGTTQKASEEKSVSAVESEEIDLSDLEKILDAEEEGEPAIEAAEASEELELDLDIDIEPEPESAADAVKAEETPATEDLDLSDLETELKLEETPAAEAGAAKPAEDLELEFITEEPAAEELQFDGAAEPDTGGEAEEILMMVEDGPPAEKKEAVAAAEPERAVEEKGGEKPRKKAVPFRPKRRAGAFRIILLLVVLLIGGAVMLPTFGIQVPFVGYLRNIPYVGDLFGAKADERGNLKMSSFDLESKFVGNTKSGELFVITGKIRNGYDHPRGFIKVTGRLYSKGKKPAAVQTVFCGNTLPDKELSSLDLAAIKKELLQRSGQKQSDTRVLPGMHVPFMMVFSNLPPDLEEFTVEVDESQPAS